MRIAAFDFETTKMPYFHPWQKEAYAVMLSMVWEDGSKRSWVLNHDDHNSPEADQQLMLRDIQAEVDKTDILIAQRAKFDLNWLRKIGIDFESCDIHCTKIAEYIIEGHRKIGYDLDSIAERHGISIRKLDQVKMYWESGYETSEIPLHILIPYCERDCQLVMDIYHSQVRKIKEMNLKLPVLLANRLSVMLSEIECNGILADKELGMQLVGEIQQQLDLIDIGLKGKLGDINLSSGDELSAGLFGGIIKRKGRETVQRVLKSGEVKEYERNCIIETEIDGAGFKPAKGTETKKEGYYQTSKGIIEQLGGRTKVQKEIKRGLLARSAVAKSLESLWGEKGTGIINKIQADACVHPQYNQTVTTTGRLSSSDPNGQNLPQEGTSPIKRILIPRYDEIVSADLSTLEWNVGALLSQDEVMIQEILDGVDVHGNNAVNFFGDISYRKTAKFFTFRLLYGGSPYGFYMDHKMPAFTIKHWERIVNDFYNKYSGLKRWQTNNVRKVQESGRLYIPSGRFFRFPRVKGDYSPRQIKNYPVQGFSFDIMALAMLVIRKHLGSITSKIIGQVHDELVFDAVKEETKFIGRTCIEAFENLPKYMRQFWKFDCPVPFTGNIERGQNYEQMEEIPRDYFFK